jgi:FAD/FMN-containing dehydrogenase
MRLGRVDVTELRRRFGSRLVMPTDDAYETRRLVDNGAIDRRPAAIVEAADVDEVAAVIGVARSSGVPLAIRSGGHSVAGHSTGDGVLVLDLSRMNSMDIDEASRTTWIGAGVRAGVYTRTAYAFGLATPFGDTGSVGIGGLTLGGGIGWLVRKHGLTIDSLIAVEVVTASGERVVATADETPDLFWAVSGGGGNFGVATRFKLRLHPIGTVLHGTIVLPATAAVLEGLVPAGLAAPDELTLMPSVFKVPPIDEIPREHHGTLAVFLDLMWAGPIDAGRQALSVFRALATPIFEDVAEKPYPDVYPERPSNRDPWTSRSIFLPGFDRDSAAVVDRWMSTPASESALFHLRILGGAVARVPNAATAFAWRDQAALAWIIADFTGMPAGELPVHDAWAADFRTALQEHGVGTYVNFMGDEGPEAVRLAYPGPTWDRLVEIKQRYDPGNLFRLNQNVPPSG